jgi:hypothetical protein
MTSLRTTFSTTRLNADFDRDYAPDAVIADTRELTYAARGRVPRPACLGTRPTNPRILEFIPSRTIFSPWAKSQIPVVNGSRQNVETRMVEQSVYVLASIQGVGVHELEVRVR